MENNNKITLPANTPLMCDAEEASRIFGIGRTTLYMLARQYPDFPAVTVGRGVRYLVPDMYAWFRDFPDREIAMEKKCRPVGAGRR